MKYLMLLKPFANVNYRKEALTLAAAEAHALLEKAGVTCEVKQSSLMDADTLEFECSELTDRQKETLSLSSHLYLLFMQGENGLVPVSGKRRSVFGDELPLILKYKGKTNETFTEFMLNMALCSSSFDTDQGLTVLDPMCSKGTTLFEALNRGWNALGFDSDGKAVAEGSAFFKKYLEMNRLKHTAAEKSLTAKGKELTKLTVFETAASAEEFKKGNKQTLSMGSADSSKLTAVYKKPVCDLIVCDLPYGVQHSASDRKQPLEDMLYNVLPVWTELLRTGGAMALSFNTNTLKSEMVRGMMAEVGLDVMFGEDYDHLTHRVEQAITRDVAVAVRRF